MGRAVGISCGCGRTVDTYLGRGFVTLLWEDDDSGILAQLDLTPMQEQAQARNLEADEFTLDPERTLAWLGKLRQGCARAGAELPPFYRVWHRQDRDTLASAAPIFQLDGQHYLVEAHDTVLGIRPIDAPDEEVPVVASEAPIPAKARARWASANAMTAAEFDQVFAGSEFELDRGTLVEAFAAELEDIEEIAEHAALERHALRCFHY